MTQHQDIAEDRLIGYLDGLLSADEVARIDAAARADPALADRLEALRAPMDALGAEADDLLRFAPPAPDFSVPAPAPAPMSGPVRAPMRLAGLAAALLLGVGLGGLGMTQLLGQKPDQKPGWVQAVVDYQALYVPETLAGISAPAPESRATLDRFAEAQNLQLAQVTTLSEVDFRRAQVLGFDGSPLLQIAYVDDAGRPVALCVLGREEADRSPEWSEAQGMSVVSWVRDGAGFALVSAMPEDDLRRVHAEIMTRLHGGA